MELKYGNEKQSKFAADRGTTILDLIEMAKTNFTKARDKHELSKIQKTMFEPEMDLELDCFCKMT